MDHSSARHKSGAVAFIACMWVYIAVLYLSASVVRADVPPGLMDLLSVPPGFNVTVFGSVLFARSLCLSPNGTLYVSSYSFVGISGATKSYTKVWAMRDSNGDGVADVIQPVTGDLWVPNGIAWLNGDLYVALIDQILRYRDIENQIGAPPATPEVFLAPGVLPTSTWHGWRYMVAGPDNGLYLAIGSPCNVPCDADCDCANADRYPLYGTIVRVDPNTAQVQVVVRGVRNSLGIAFHPVTGDLWFTDNGRDNWNPNHDSRPPDELNTLSRSTLQQVLAGTLPPPHYGFPFCYGRGDADPNFNLDMSCANYTGAVAELAPHAAALGTTVYPGDAFPDRYAFGFFIAEHGSWDRQPPNGFRVSAALPQDDGSFLYEPFLAGFTDPNRTCVTDDDCPATAVCMNATRSRSGQVYAPPFYCAGWGRPADVAWDPRSGGLWVSDEQSGVLYLIRYVSVPWYRSLGFLIGAPLGAGLLLLIVGAVLLGRYLRQRGRAAYTSLDTGGSSSIQVPAS